MKIKIKVHSGSTQEKIVKINEGEFEIWIKQKPIEGKANAVLEKLLGKYFNAESKIVSGLRSNKKIVEIKDK